MPAEVESMVSANNIVPWHKEGTVLEGYPTIDAMYIASGLDWTVEKRTLYYKKSEDELIECPTLALVRDKDNTCLGTCSSKYEIFQNKDAFNWCSKLIDTGLWKMETAGALRGGQLCWALLNQGDKEVIKGDKLKNYLLVHWSHDGSMSVQVGLTSIRVVCNNTLQQALNSLGDRHKVRHSASLPTRMSSIQALYDEAAYNFKHQQEEFAKLVDVKVDSDDREAFITDVAKYVVDINNYTQSDDKSMKKYNRRLENVKADMLNYALNGSGMKELKIQDTAWGLFNGVEEYLEYNRGRIREQGCDVLFGRGAQLIEKAYNRIQDLAYSK